MICQKCQANVDNDLVFCTNCGVRLNETWNQAPAALINESVVTKTSIPTGQQKSSSNLKWVALIVGLIAIPASLFGGYLLLNSNNPSTTENVNRQTVPVSTPNRRANTNQNNTANVSNANAVNSNDNPANSSSPATNQNTNTNNSDKTEIMNERIEIAPNSHYALPFKIDNETAKMTGNLQVLEGEPLEGYVYFQDMYDQHFPDATYKVFSIDVSKNSDVNQTLIKGDYVLVFVNKKAKSSTIQGKITVVEK